jgi:hypothetical protein
MVASQLFLIIPFCAGVLLPQPGGEYQVTHNTTQLIDTHRLDPWHKDTIPYRRLMISRFDPIPPDTCYCNELISYMSPVTATAEDAILGTVGWPAGVLGDIEMVFCTTSPALPFPSTINGNAPPIVLFSPGLNTSRLFYSAIA